MCRSERPLRLPAAVLLALLAVVQGAARAQCEDAALSGPGLHFGAVSLAGDRLLAGPGDVPIFTLQVQLFERQGETWVPSQPITAAGVGFLDYFGRAVALGDGVALVSGVSRTFAFEERGTGWVEVQEIPAVGLRLDLDGSRALMRWRTSSTARTWRCPATSRWWGTRPTRASPPSRERRTCMRKRARTRSRRSSSLPAPASTRGSAPAWPSRATRSWWGRRAASWSGPTRAPCSCSRSRVRRGSRPTS